MARNVEIKARIASVEAMVGKVADLADGEPREIRQDDTFFHCPYGRLKLRVFSDGEGQLIFYQRSDGKGPKESAYEIYPTTDPDKLRQVLSMAYGEAGRVRKHRTQYWVGRTRIHLDRVEGLGHFLELEVVLGEGEAAEAGVAVAHELLDKLGISPDQLIADPYVDLLVKYPLI
jgi:predicted adenylyl cyclase CyaB